VRTQLATSHCWQRRPRLLHRNCRRSPRRRQRRRRPRPRPPPTIEGRSRRPPKSPSTSST
jgi:hypothetical protein